MAAARQGEAQHQGMGRDQEHSQVLLLASPPPQNQGEQGQLPQTTLIHK